MRNWVHDLSGFGIQFPYVVIVRHGEQAPHQIAIHNVGGIVIDATETPRAQKDEKDENQSIGQSQFQTARLEHEMSPHEIDEELDAPIDEGNVGGLVESSSGHEDQISRVTCSGVEKCPNWSIDHSRWTPWNFETFVPLFRFRVLLLQIKLDVAGDVGNETGHHDVGEFVGANSPRRESLARHDDGLSEAW